MASFVKKWKAFQKTTVGQILQLVIYAAMLVLALIYFTGNGVFIYEAF